MIPMPMLGLSEEDKQTGVISPKERRFVDPDESEWDLMATVLGAAAFATVIGGAIVLGLSW